MTLMEFLRTDKELQSLHEEWNKKVIGPFPPYNTDEYSGISDYKDKVKRKLIDM